MNCLWMVIGGIVVALYLIGVYVYCDIETTMYIKDDDGGGYRDLTPKDVRMALIWPLFVLLFIVKVPIAVVNEMVLPFILLVFGYYYRDTRMYKYLDKLTE